jgi:subtilisin family serine protease
MKRFVGLFAILLLLAMHALQPAGVAAGTRKPGTTPVAPAKGRAIPNRYIVEVRAGADPRAVAAIAGVSPRYVYTAALNGFAAELNVGQLNAIQHQPNVQSVEQDQEVHLDATQNMDANGDPWGLDRIDQRALPLSRTYSYTGNGQGVRAYIIDTGIQTDHPDFGGRASAVYDAFGGNGQDCNGHGTHVAGTVAGATYGVAKAAYLRAVRVLDCSGSGSISGIIAGVNWVAQNRIRPAVANMSLGGGYSSSLNSAVTNLVNSGVFVAVAAGNSNADACNYSPASAPGTYTVAAEDKTDTRASFSNYGGCVDGYAPGVAIKSDWLSSGTNTISGTSMATPHVTGVGALYKGDNGDAPASTIINWIRTNATANVIKSNPAGTNNLLLYKGGL